MNNNLKQLIIKGDLDGAIVLRLYDLQGKVLHNRFLNSNEAIQNQDISTLTSGIYIVELRSNSGEKRIQKLIIK